MKITKHNTNNKVSDNTNYHNKPTMRPGFTVVIISSRISVHILQNYLITIKYLSDTVFWLAVFILEYETRNYGKKTFECTFRTGTWLWSGTPWSSNQITVFIGYIFLIRRFSSTRSESVLKSFMNVRSAISKNVFPVLQMVTDGYIPIYKVYILDGFIGVL